MKRLKKFLSASRANVVIFSLAAALVLAASIGGASAAVVYFSSTYASEVSMYDIGVSLIENDDTVSWRNYVSSRTNGEWDEVTGELLKNMLREGEKLALGKPYPEELSVRNSGTLNEYVRVTVFRYWVIPGESEEDEQKLTNLSPSYIDLHFCCDATGSDNGWLLDEAATTEERTVLYYNRLLKCESEAEGAGGASQTPFFADTLTISGAIAEQTETIQQPDGTLKTVYTYEGAQFVVEVEVDAIQELNAQDAIRSAWGTNVVVSDGVLTLR